MSTVWYYLYFMYVYVYKHNEKRCWIDMIWSISIKDVGIVMIECAIDLFDVFCVWNFRLLMIEIFFVCIYVDVEWMCLVD